MSLQTQIAQLQQDYRTIERDNFIDHYLILCRVRDIVELIGLGSFDHGFRHIYREAMIYLRDKPQSEDQEVAGIQRENDYLVHNLGL